MTETSDSMEIEEIDDTFKTPPRLKKKRKRRSQGKQEENYTESEINQIIIGTSQQKISNIKIPTFNKNPSDNDNHARNIPQKAPTTNYNYYSQKIKNVINKEYKNVFYINTNNNTNRFNLVDKWIGYFPNAKDIILKTSKGFVLKSDNDKNILKTTLKLMQQAKIILNFEESKPIPRAIQHKSTDPSSSCVIGQVEDLEDTVISQHLHDCGIEHRFCKRIISRTTQRKKDLNSNYNRMYQII